MTEKSEMFNFFRFMRKISPVRLDALNKITNMLCFINEN